MFDVSRLVTLDFETYYDQEYSLTAQKYNMSGYVRDPQFQVHCLGYKIGDEKAQWLLPEDVQAFLESIDWSTHSLLAHNTAFDGFILSHHYRIWPAFYYDTMAMTRGLHPESTAARLGDIAQFYGIGTKDKTALKHVKGKRVLDELTMLKLGTYCSNDVDLCHEVFLRQIDVYPEKERVLIDWSIRAFTDPILQVNIPLAEEALKQEVEEKQALINAAGVTEEVLNSPTQFADELRKLGVEPPMKWSHKQAADIYAFAQSDGEFLDLLEHDDIKVVQLVQARIAAKSTIGETRAKRMIEAGSDGQKLPVLLVYYGAKTGRFSGGNKMNMQNLPRGGALRRSIIAPKDHVILAVDSSQIEARYNAWLAGQDDLVEAFREGKDIYSEFASEVFGYEVNRKYKEIGPDGKLFAPQETEGFVGKVCILGLGYQMSGKKLQSTLGLGTMGKVVELELAQCMGMVAQYRRRMHKIVEQWRALEEVLIDLIKGVSGRYAGLLEYEPGTYMQPNCVWLPNGMALQYPKLRPIFDDQQDRPRGYMYETQRGLRSIYGGKLCENIIQALARVDVTEKMVEAGKRGHRIASMSHDEILAVVPKSEAEGAKRDLIELMSTPPKWAPTIPLAAEASYADYYSK